LQQNWHMWRHGRAVVAAFVTLAVVVLALLSLGDAPTSEHAPEPAVEAEEIGNVERVVSEDERRRSLARAQVWRRPRVPVAQASLGAAPDTPASIACRFTLDAVGGTTPKFNCLREDGTEMRVKYGSGAEIPAEAAATRLLAALGFGADHVTIVPRVRCFGCPQQPFAVLKSVTATGTEPLYEHVIDYDSYQDFEWAAVERRFPAPAIESETVRGWGMFELDTIDSDRGGAPREHVDALKLLATLLVHWDNKSENQRLVCLQAGWKEGTPCTRPFALLQDVGATFGPRKVDLDDWAASPIWKDRAACLVSMRDLPHDGATFADSRISEGGRRFLAGLLTQLSSTQLRELFAGARFDQSRSLLRGAHALDDWVRVFQTKIDAVAQGPPCPTA
jgi:hypothetical protein